MNKNGYTVQIRKQPAMAQPDLQSSGMQMQYAKLYILRENNSEKKSPSKPTRIKIGLHPLSQLSWTWKHNYTEV